MPKPNRKILGPAARWLAVKRKGRLPVKLTFSQKAVGLLNLMLRAPETLTSRVQGMQPWKAKDEPGARQIIRLQHWLEKSVLKKVTEERYDIPETWAGALPGTYVDRLKEIARHYEPVGLAVGFSESYYDLLDSLEGKAPATDLDELVGYTDPAEATESEKKS